MFLDSVALEGRFHGSQSTKEEQLGCPMMRQHLLCEHGELKDEATMRPEMDLTLVMCQVAPWLP